MITLAPPGARLAVLDQTMAFLARVAPDGSELVARGRVTHRRDQVVLSTAEIVDGDGNIVAVCHLTSLLMPPRRKEPPTAQPDRVLATLMFTDLRLNGAARTAGRRPLAGAP